MVFGCEHHVLLASGAGQINEGEGIELCGIKPLGQLAILGFGDAAGLGNHDWPRGFHAGQGVRPPMNEHAKLGSSVPGRALIGEHRGKSQIGQQRKRRRGQSKSEEVATAGQGATRILGVIAEIKKWSQGFPCSLSF